MKKLLFLLLCFDTGQALGQIYIKYDLNTRITDKPIPFDKPFFLEVSPVKSKTINKVVVYWTDFEKGKVVFKDPTNPTPPSFRPSFELKKEPRSDDTKVIFSFPALKPEQDFRILLNLNFSAKTNLKLYTILNEMYNADPKNGNPSTNTAALDSSLQKFIFSLEVSFPGDLYPISPLQNNFATFESGTYRPLKPYLYGLLDTANKTNNYEIIHFLTQDELTLIANHLEPKSYLSGNIQYAQRILNNQSTKAISLDYYHSITD